MAVFSRGLLSFSILLFTSGALAADLPAPNPTPPPPPPPFPNGVTQRQDMNPFRPSVAVIVGVLTTMFSITFLLLLYAKHCKRVNINYPDQYSSSVGGVPHSSSAARKNSGIDRTVIESLPIFRFSSLMGLKEGLECAVCLNRFDPSEVLRLLPKCKHAFHVECVDTWLDAHSTCPLCRYRVDPEDILLVEDHANIFPRHNPIAPPQSTPPREAKEAVSAAVADQGFRRVFGRHSSAGERGSKGGFVQNFQIVVQKPGDAETGSLDPASFRRSLDSLGQKKRVSEAVAVGCFDRGRKDGLLLSDDGTSIDRSRFEHRIVVSGRSSRSISSGFQQQQRWSDVQPSDLLYLRSEMIISDSSRGFASASWGRKPRQANMEEDSSNGNGSIDGVGGRSVINERSVSEITGLSRFSSRENRHRRRGRHDDDDRRHAGVVSRWLAWIASQSRPQEAADVRPARTSASAAAVA